MDRSLERAAVYRHNRIISQPSRQTLGLEDAFFQKLHVGGPSEAILGAQARGAAHNSIASLPNRRRKLVAQRRNLFSENS